MNHKKQKPMSSDDRVHAESCPLHDDFEKLKTICNGVKISGTRCANNVKRQDSASSISRRRLSMCKMHASQTRTLGFCEAGAVCGYKCDRVVSWTPCENQLCERHRDATLTCHLLKIPADLRVMIFELLVPKGPITLRALRSYATTLNLLEVCEEINREVSRILFHYKERPCLIAISNNAIRLLRRVCAEYPGADENYGNI